jgi:rubrerythrin
MKIEEYRAIISMAIGNEIAAYEFYDAVSKKTADANMRGIFGQLAEQELGHRHFLEGLMSSARPMQFDVTRDYKVSESVEKPKLSMTMKPADAMALAMKEEEEAMLMYEALASSSTDPEQKAMFHSLAEMEKSHKIKLEDLYTNTAFPEVW